MGRGGVPTVSCSGWWGLKGLTRNSLSHSVAQVQTDAADTRLKWVELDTPSQELLVLHSDLVRATRAGG